ncbi:unnamed protein product, partial [Lymnaea stagnalis]
QLKVKVFKINQTISDQYHRYAKVSVLTCYLVPLIKLMPMKSFSNCIHCSRINMLNKSSAKAQLGINILQNFRDWFNTNKNDFSIDFVHNYRFEEHDTNAGYHLLVAISDVSGDRACHLIEVTPDWEKDLEDTNKVHVITEEIYHLISTHTLHESTMTYNDLSNIYGDADA